jgi:hypothetical protein
MHSAQYQAYKRWLEKWLPHLLYGSSVSMSAPAATSAPETKLTDLPGGAIVRAY